MHAPLALALAQIGGMTVGIPAGQVEETLRGPLAITPFPRAARHMPGAFAFRGGAVPVLDLAAMLRGDGAEPGGGRPSEAYAMVLRVAGARFAITLDALRGVVVAPAERITRVEARGEGPAAGFFDRLFTPCDGGPVAVVLDLKAALAAEGLLAALAADDDKGARVVATEREDAHLVFSLGGESYALPTGAITGLAVRPAVLESEWPHPVVRGFYRGRDGLTPVLELAALLEVRGGGGGVLLRIEAEGRRAALIVDAPSRIESPAEGGGGPGGDARFSRVWADGRGAVVRALSAEVVRAALTMVDASSSAETGAGDEARGAHEAAEPHLFFKAAGAMLAAPLRALDAVAHASPDFGGEAASRPDAFVDHLAIKGRAVAVYDLARLLGRGPTRRGGVVLVARGGDGATGFLVDGVEFSQASRPRPLPGARGGGVASRFSHMVSAERDGAQVSASVLDLDKLAEETAAGAKTTA